ncbi:MAG: PD40 domain-containing protein [Chthonomonas sp.]|nr:PD40 domain-containing protein [Chthonomonas sp.]
MKLSNLALVSLSLALAGTSSAALRRVSGPAPSPDGSQIVFSWQGDIWIGSAKGGDAKRLTVHPGNEITPKFTPDGKRIVFVSDRTGGADFYSMSVDGGDLTRLSFDGAAKAFTAISADGKKILGSTSMWGRGSAFMLPMTGGDIVQMTRHPLEVQHAPSLSPDGSKMVFVNGASLGAWRKTELKGANTGEIYVASSTPLASDAKRLTTNEFHDSFPLFAPDGDIVFISNRSGWPNVWRMNGDGSGAKKLTNHSRGAVRYPSLSANGALLTYEFDGDIYALNMTSGDSRKVEFEAPADSRTSPMIEEVATSANEIATSPDGKRAAILVRGDIYVMPARGGTTRKLTKSLAMDENIVWLDNKTLLFVSGRNGKRELWTVDTDGNEKLFYADKTDVMGVTISPDRTMLAASLGDKAIVTMPAKGGAPKTLLSGQFIDAYDEVPQVDWSPDSKWVAVQMLNVRGATIEAVEVASGKRIVVGTTARGGSLPRWMPNGKGIFYTASGAEGDDLYYVELSPPETRFTEDDLDKIDDTPAKPDAKVDVKIDERGLVERTRILARDVTGASVFGNSIYANVAGVFSAISTTGAVTAVPGVTGPGFVLPGDPRQIISNGGRFSLLSPAGLVPITFSVQLSINSRDEEKALFQEICWSLEKKFYDPNMHGKDWTGIKAKFAAMMPHTVDRADFYAMIGEMLEELESSHQGATAPRSATAARGESSGWLGFDWDSKLLANGKYVVGQVLPGTPADNADSRLMTGDEILSINGTSLATTPAAKLMIGTAGTKMRLEVRRGGKNMIVLIKPTSTALATSVRYNDWVKWNREQVERISGGQLTYHHIQGMDEPSYQKFLWEMRTLTTGKKGVVLDVRYNGGGSTSHKILGILVKRPWLYRTFRAAPETMISEDIYRGDALQMPSALMTNQYSFSNAEIMSEGFQRLKVGPVIGERTAGGVIGTSAVGFWDGGSIRMPAIGCYTLDGENLERNGRKPNFSVPFDLNRWHAGQDTQLEMAIKQLLKVVETKKM